MNLPIRTDDRTPKENTRITKEHYDAQMKKKKPEPRPVYTEMQKNNANCLLALASQYDLTHKPDDCSRSAKGRKKYQIKLTRD
jgi:hypothetical protein